MDSSYNSWENEVLLMEIGDGILNIWLNISPGSKQLKCSFYAPDSNVK